jgi:hypothetical protein
MDPSEAIYIEKELHMPHEELLGIIIDYRKKEFEYAAFRIENQNALTAMAKDYQALKAKLESTVAERDLLKEELRRIAEQNQLKTKDIFGRSTEKLSDIIGAPLDTEYEDEETAEVIEIPPEGNEKTLILAGAKKSRKHGKKLAGKRDKDLTNLPQSVQFRLDIEGLDQIYGEGNWRIAYWHNHRTVEVNPKTAYVLNSYSPVISVGLEHELITIKNPDVLLKNSIASASLAAEILYQKFFLSLPVYRQAQAFDNFGLVISRQTMNNWVIRFSFDLFGPIYDYFQRLMLEVPYHQCDETTLRVNNDGRAAGSKSYMWVHITSELLNTHPIVLFCYELTRGTDHLREFYKDFEGYITCDAYCSYHVLGKENKDVICICGCMMHMRRRYAKSLALIDKSKASEAEILELPETKALVLIGKIYDADEALKSLSAEERLAQRKAIVRPLIDEYFEFVDGIDTSNPLVSGTLKDAVNYSKNQKEYLSRFLTDGNIPIDNGATERHIRPFTIGRNNFLGCNSTDGAESTAIMYSIVETARANKANVYYYLKYILEQMPNHMEGRDTSFLKAMVPWSEEYREYERINTCGKASKVTPKIYDSKPRTPKKHKPPDNSTDDVA